MQGIGQRSQSCRRESESHQRGEGLLSLGRRREQTVRGATGNKPRRPRAEWGTISPRGGETCDGLSNGRDSAPEQSVAESSVFRSLGDLAKM